jgi:ribose transport system ATP-binding protein
VTGVLPGSGPGSTPLLASPAAGTEPGQSLLEVIDISKHYPGVQALEHVHLVVECGEVHALLGENGAGKSTLIKIIAGAEHADAGQISFLGQPARFDNPYAARVAGIASVFQEFTLIPDLSVAENIFVHQDSAYRFGWILDRGSIDRRVRELFDRIGIGGLIEPGAKVRTLSVVQQQLVEIAKAIALDARLIILDEPTSALSPQEVRLTFSLVRSLVERGIGFIFVTHRLNEVAEIATSVTVLRDGRNILSRVPVAELTTDQIIRAMVGRDIDQVYVHSRTDVSTAPLLSVCGLGRKARLRDISFDVHPGEIVGVAGLVGSGRTELLRAIFGAEPADRGEIQVRGRPVRIRSPQDAIREGIAMVPEDRKRDGLLLLQTIRHNLNLPYLSLGGGWLLSRPAESARAGAMSERLAIRSSGVEQRAESLSGGNQQKVVLGKWLINEPGVLLLDDPTRGIDVGAKAGIYRLIDELTQAGLGIVLVSSEMPELLALADRLIVLREGALSATLSRADATPDLLMRYATPLSRTSRADAQTAAPAARDA